MEIAGKRITIAYGRPLVAGRPIFGTLVPWGEIWRTGADEATKLSTELELRLGGFVVPPGEYALFTVPGERAWEVVVNKAADQWGAFNHDPRLDVARAPMRVERLSLPLDRLSIALHRSGESAGSLWIGWERSLASLEFEITPPPPPASAPLTAQ